MSLEILDAERDPQALLWFLVLPEAVYRGDPGYNATPRSDVLAGLHRPDFAGARRVWVAVEGERPLARLAALRSPALKNDTGRPYGMIGFFEAVDGPDGREATRRLFLQAIGWLGEAGTGAVLGPMDGDTWHKYRLNAGPWDDPPFLLEPWNPPYYEALWKAAGFQVLESYFSTRVETAAVVAALEPKHRAALAAGYRLRCLDMDRFEDELRLLYRLSTAIFAGNFLYTEIPESEFLALYTGSRPILDPDLVWFARSAVGEDVGFLFAYPDRFRAVAAMRGRRSLLAKLRFLRHRHEADAVDFKTLGVLPGHRRSGLAAALMYQGHRVAQEKGWRTANHCLFREGNPSGEMDGGSGRLLRRYHLYRYEG